MTRTDSNSKWTTARLKKQYEYYRKRYFGELVPPADTITIEWSNRLTASAGICKQSGDSKIIRLSTHYHRRHPNEISNTLLHEMIHLVVPNHGAEFHAWVERLAKKGEEVPVHASERATRPEYRYVVRCSHCGEVVGRNQRWTRRLEAIVRQPTNWRCLHCNRTGTLEVFGTVPTSGRQEK